jgi:hypothetical protein
MANGEARPIPLRRRRIRLGVAASVVPAVINTLPS